MASIRSSPAILLLENFSQKFGILRQKSIDPFSVLILPLITPIRTETMSRYQIRLNKFLQDSTNRRARFPLGLVCLWVFSWGASNGSSADFIQKSRRGTCLKLLAYREAKNAETLEDTLYAGF